MIEELFTYWNLEDADQTLEELEDALIVSTLRRAAPRRAALHCAAVAAGGCWRQREGGEPSPFYWPAGRACWAGG